MYSTQTYQCRREEQERIYKLYNKNFIVLQLNIEHYETNYVTKEDRCTRQ